MPAERIVANALALVVATTLRVALDVVAGDNNIVDVVAAAAPDYGDDTDYGSFVVASEAPAKNEVKQTLYQDNRAY